MVTALPDAAPDELADIWDRLPSTRWLSRELADHRIAWMLAGTAQTVDQGAGVT